MVMVDGDGPSGAVRAVKYSAVQCSAVMVMVMVMVMARLVWCLQ
jgi:hypothetical protein